MNLNIDSDFGPRLRKVEDSVLRIETTIPNLATREQVETRVSRTEFWTGLGIILTVIGIAVAVVIAANAV